MSSVKSQIPPKKAEKVVIQVLTNLGYGRVLAYRMVRTSRPVSICAASEGPLERSDGDAPSNWRFFIDSQSGTIFVDVELSADQTWHFVRLVQGYYAQLQNERYLATGTSVQVGEAMDSSGMLNDMYGLLFDMKRSNHA